MTRGQGNESPTPGLEGMDAVEIKITIRADQELLAERAFQVREDRAQSRTIYFFDTPKLELFDAGVVLRARLVSGGDDDSTVKLRPVKAAQIAPEWKRMNGFKLEADSVGDHVVCSASLTQLQKSSEIEDIVRDKRPIEKLFSKEQERFLAELHDGAVDFGRLRVLGPIRVLRWKPTPKGFEHELTLEEWRLPDGEDLVEVSLKTPPEGAAEARKAFEQRLRDLGLDPQGAQAAKTRTVLQHFAKAIGPRES